MFAVDYSRFESPSSSSSGNFVFQLNVHHFSSFFFFYLTFRLTCIVSFLVCCSMVFCSRCIFDQFLSVQSIVCTRIGTIYNTCARTCRIEKWSRVQMLSILYCSMRSTHHQCCTCWSMNVCVCGYSYTTMIKMKTDKFRQSVQKSMKKNLAFNSILFSLYECFWFTINVFLINHLIIAREQQHHCPLYTHTLNAPHNGICTPWIGRPVSYSECRLLWIGCAKAHRLNHASHKQSTNRLMD